MAVRAEAYDIRRSLIPFITRVLHYGTQRFYAPEPWPLPVGEPDIYYEEDVEALRHVLPQGVLYCWCHAAQGWDPRPILIGREAWSAQERSLRLWEAAQQKGLSLHFTLQGLELCEGLYNVVAKLPPKSKRVKRSSLHTEEEEIKRLNALDLQHSGDFALAYWLWVGLWKDIDPDDPETRQRGRAAWRPLISHFVQNHPMLALRYGPWVETSPPAKDNADLTTFITGPFQSVLPWWMDHALSRWTDLEHLIWQSQIDAHKLWRTRQTQLVETWVKTIAATGWLHLLVPFADLFRSLWVELLLDANPKPTSRSRAQRDPELVPSLMKSLSNDEIAQRAITRLNTSYGEERQQERFETREAWSKMLSSVSALVSVYDKTRLIHPAERDSNHDWFVGWWSREGFSELTQRLTDVAKRIEGRLG